MFAVFDTIMLANPLHKNDMETNTASNKCSSTIENGNNLKHNLPPISKSYYTIRHNLIHMVYKISPKAVPKINGIYIISIYKLKKVT